MKIIVFLIFLTLCFATPIENYTIDKFDINKGKFLWKIEGKKAIDTDNKVKLSDFKFTLFQEGDKKIYCSSKSGVFVKDKQTLAGESKLHIEMDNFKSECKGFIIDYKRQEISMKEKVIMQADIAETNKEQK